MEVFLVPVLLEIVSSLQNSFLSNCTSNNHVKSHPNRLYHMRVAVVSLYPINSIRSNHISSRSLLLIIIQHYLSNLVYRRYDRYPGIPGLYPASRNFFEANRHSYSRSYQHAPPSNRQFPGEFQQARLDHGVTRGKTLRLA